MKKVSFLLGLLGMAVVLFSGCQKDTTYTFVDNYGGSVFSEYSILLCEYDGAGTKVFTNKLDYPKVGQMYVYTANEHAVMIKVKIQAQVGSTSFNRWIQQAFYLEKGGNINITLDGETIVGSNEP